MAKGAAKGVTRLSSLLLRFALAGVVAVMRQRDCLPIALLDVPACVPTGLSRGCRQRIQRRRAIAERTNIAVRVLNDLWDPPGHIDDAPTASRPLLDDTEKIRDHMARFHLGDTQGAPPEEAARQLLGQHLSYYGSEESSTLGSFDHASVVLPSAIAPPQDICGMLDEEAAVFVKD